MRFPFWPVCEKPMSRRQWRLPGKSFLLWHTPTAMAGSSLNIHGLALAFKVAMSMT